MRGFVPTYGLILVALGVATATADELRVQHPRITVINFDPILTSQGDQRLHDYWGWYDPFIQMSTYLGGMAEASHDLALERMTQFIDMDFWPVKADGFQYTEAQYIAGNWHFPDGVDYNTIARDYDLARKVDRGEVDEVKVFGAPYFGYWESTMAGKGGYWCNSGAQQKIACSKIFIMMGWNYERSVSLHATGHRAESIMTEVYDGWNVDGDRTIWDRFGWNIGQTTISSIYGVGSAHYPCNGDADYDYGNPQRVTSCAPDWLNNFPNFTGETELVGRLTWGLPWEFNFFKWWYQHMPHVAGRNALDGYDRLNNWWEYIFNFNAHPESGGEHVLGGAPPPASPYPAVTNAITTGSADNWAPQVSVSGRVVWYGFDGNDFEIYSADADGSGFTQITANAFIDEAPRINASGQIVWQAFDGRDYEIFTAAADGSNLIQVTNNFVNDWHADISDTGRIVWDRWDGEDYEVCSANADGSDVVQISNTPYGGTGKRPDDVWPRINGSDRVVWFGFDGGDWEIYSADADGGGLVQLSNNAYDDEYPQISDAGKVVWHTWHNNSNVEVYAADAGGGALVQLTNDGRQDWWPQLNDAGDVVWMHYDGSDWEIVLGSVAGGSTINITDNSVHDQYPRIDAAGRIVWQGLDGADWEIYVAEAGAVYQITDNDYDDRWPQLSGTGRTAWHAESVSTSDGPASNIFTAFHDGSLPPTAFDGEVETHVDTPVEITLGGATGSGGPLDFIISTLPAHGTLNDLGGGEILAVPYTLVDNGQSVLYTPNPVYYGGDSFTFKVNDGQDSNPASVSIAVLDTHLEVSVAATPIDSSFASALASDGTHLYMLRRDSHQLYRTADDGAMWEARAGPAADLGGWHGDWYSGMLAFWPAGGAAGALVSRHRDSADDLDKVVIYDIDTDTWSWTSVYTVAGHAAVVVDDYLYGVWHAGGSNYGGPIIRVNLNAPSAIIDERSYISPSLSGDDPHWYSRAAQLATVDGLVYGIKNDWVTSPRGTGDRIYRFDPADFRPAIWTGVGPGDYWNESAWSADPTPADDLGEAPFEPGYGAAMAALPADWSSDVGGAGGLFVIAGRSPSDQEGWGAASADYAIYDIASGEVSAGSLPGVTGGGGSAAFHNGKVFIKRGGDPEAPYNDDLWIIESVFDRLEGDTDGDCDVDLADLATLLASYGATAGATYTNGDFDQDGDVDLGDLATLLSSYGVSCD